MNDQQLKRMLPPVVLLLVLLIGFLPNSVFFFFLKIIIFIVLAGGIMYFLKRSPLALDDETDRMEEASFQEPVISPPNSTLLLNSEEDIERHFNLFLETFLPLAKQILVANSVVLLLVNVYKRKFYIRAKHTDWEDSFTRESFFNLNEGLPGLILKSRKPLLENHLPESEHLLPYYQTATNPVRSFLGVPLFFDDYLIGIMCVDSEVEQSFSDEDQKILERLCDVLSIQLASSNKLYEYETKNWTTQFLSQFSKRLLEIQQTTDLFRFLGDELQSTFGADRVVISGRKNENGGKVLYVQGAPASLSVNEEFPDNEGIVGWVLRKNQSMLVEDFSTKENYIPRFLLSEKLDQEMKSFLAVPVAREDQVRLVIALESKQANSFTEQHKKILETISYQVAAFLEKATIVEQLESRNLIDPDTQLGNARAFLSELKKEISRSREFDKRFVLQLCKLNPNQAELDNELKNQLLNEFVSFLLPNLQPTDYIFRFSDMTFAIIRVEKKLKEILPEIRRVLGEISEKKAWANGFVEELYVNVGVVQFPEMGSEEPLLLENAQNALRKSEARGFNIVEIYQGLE